MPRRQRHCLLAAAVALALLGLPVALVTSPADAATATVPIYGQVVDANGDGLDGVTVTALDSTTLEPVGSSAVSAEPPDGEDPNPVGDSGEFTLRVPAGSYEIEYSATDYLTTYYSDSDAPSVVGVDSRGDLTISDESSDDLDVPGALDPVTLIGTTTYPVTGKVSVPSGSAQGLLVSAYDDGDDYEDDVVATATVGADGSYSLALPTGTYDLLYTDPHHALLPQWYGGADASGTPVVVGRSAVALAVVAMKAPTSDSFPIAGSVTDANWDPLAGVTVTVAPVAGGTTATTGTTDARGDYSVSVPAGSYHVSFSRSGYASAAYTDGQDSSAAVVTVDADGTLEVADDDLDANRLDDVALAGTTKYSVTGTVTDPSGGALSGVAVTAYPDQDSTPTSYTTTTGTDGGYALGLPTGEYDLYYSSPSLIPGWYQAGSGTPGTPGTPGTAVTVAKQSDASAIKVSGSGAVSIDGAADATKALGAVTLAAPTAGQTFPVAGEVDDVNDDPLAGITVKVLKTDRTTVVATATTADDGTYEIAVLPGSYDVQFSGSGYSPAVSWYNADEDPTEGPTKVTVSSTGVLSVADDPLSDNELDPWTMASTTPYSLTGTVQSADGTPMSGVTVTAYDDGDDTDAVTQATTGSAGTYSLSLPAGTYDLSYTVPGYLASWFGGVDPSGAPAAVEIATGGGVSVSGGAVGDDPVPVAGGRLDPVALVAAAADQTYPVTGSVEQFDPTGTNGDDGLSGVTVTATPTTGCASTTPITTTTGSDPKQDPGYYRLELPACSYTLSFDAAGYPTNTYMAGSSFFDDGTLTTDHGGVDYQPRSPDVITVDSTGVTTSDPTDDLAGISTLNPWTMLTAPPTQSSAPRVVGTPAPGRTLTADLGSWSPALVADDVRVMWFVGGKLDMPAEFDRSMVVPAGAVGEPVWFTISYEPSYDLGEMPVFVRSPQVTGRLARASVTVVRPTRPRAAHTRLRVRVRIPGLSRPVGSVQVMAGRSRIGRPVRLSAARNGTLTVTLPRLSKGKHTFTVVFTGPAATGRSRPVRLTLR